MLVELRWDTRSCVISDLHVQDLVEYGLGQAFSHMSLVGPVDQLLSVLFLRDNPATSGDLETEKDWKISSCAKAFTDSI